MNILKGYDNFYPEGVMRPGDVYVEIGVSRAKFLTETGLLRDDCTYHLFEPGPVSFAALQQRFVDDSHVYIHQEMIWSVRQPRKFWIAPPDEVQDSNGAVVPPTGPCTLLMMYAITLADAYRIYTIPTRHRFLVLNCEGAECEILKSPIEADFVAVAFHEHKTQIRTSPFLEEYMLKQYRTLRLHERGGGYVYWLGERK
jgi:hypothetical protein